MTFKPFSKKQLQTLCWWCGDGRLSKSDAVICDGAVRSGKTFCMTISFFAWSFYRFNGKSFAICGKTVRSLTRNIITPALPVLKELGFEVRQRASQNLLEVSLHGRTNRYYLFGGKDEASASLIQGMTLAGVMLDEVALMPRSFVEQALARCSVEGSVFWFNCNPEYPGHWFYREWILKAKQKNALYIHFKMEDNPSLSKEMLSRYQSLYSGAFYERFVMGRWSCASGAVYPFMDKPEMFCEPPSAHYEDYMISCDYGTVNPASFGLWGLYDGVWYRIKEYYFNSREQGYQKTDEEHYQALLELAQDCEVSAVTVDPSAASFIELIERRGKFRAVRANNSVVDGIRQVSCALKDGRIKICNTCTDSMREFSLYRWSENGGKDSPIKENDHAMDDIRYFVTTLLGGEEIFAVAASRN